MNDRACAACQKEHGIQPVEGTSHGYCRRHLIGNWEWMLAQVEGTPKAAVFETKIRELWERPDSDFPPDLGEVEAERLAA